MATSNVKSWKCGNCNKSTTLRYKFPASGKWSPVCETCRKAAGKEIRDRYLANRKAAEKASTKKVSFGLSGGGRKRSTTKTTKRPAPRKSTRKSTTRKSR